ncbi:MAG: hypothetical protein AAF518_06075 [Spirochaetota bacterium]
MLEENEIAVKVIAVWESIETWGQRNYPELLVSLQVGANETEIEKLTKSISQLPDSFLVSLKRHNGQTSRPYLICYQDVYRLYSIDELIEENEGKGKSIAIAEANSGDKIWMHLHNEVSFEKDSGVLRQRSHDMGGVPPTVGISYLSWLQGFASDLEAGRYEVSEYNSLQRKLPTGDDKEELIAQLAQEVLTEGGGYQQLLAKLTVAVDQPEWVVLSKISKFTLEYSLQQ